MTAREQILHRLRRPGASVHVPRAQAATAAPVVTASVDECVERFSLEAAALDIECSVHASADAVRARLAEAVRGKTVLSWHPVHLPYDGITVLERPIFGDAPRAQQAAADIGVTGCDVAIAETASVVLFSGPGRSRAVSLVPPVHIALVQRATLCLTMGEMFAERRARWRDSASCTVITGPSRTADIELTLTLGIHGPGRVMVMIGP